VRYCIDTGYPLDGPEPDLGGIMGGLSESAGAGFGIRDEQWYVKGHTRAFELAMACAHELGVELNAEPVSDIAPYVSMYWEPGLTILYLIKNRDWRAMRDDIRNDGWAKTLREWFRR